MQHSLNNKQKKTLEAIFETPVRSDIAWADIESLFVALGANVRQGRGSRVRAALNSVRSSFHEPHPNKEASKCTIKAVKDFLLGAGIFPDA